jgi:tetraacyldisaccharide 4'-kinase
MAPQAAWLEMRHAPRALLSSAGADEPLSSLQGRAVAAFCGIGNPEGFRHTLAGCGYQVAGFREFPDHHAYTPHDLVELAAWAKASDAAALVCTQKDLVKLPVDQLGGLPLRAVVIDLEILAGRELLESRLEILARKSARP